MQISIAFHLIGIVFWAGGLVLLARMLALTSGSGDAAAKAVGRLWKGYVVPGSIVALATGVYQLMVKGLGFYFAQGWFHGKVTAVLVLLAVTVVTGFEVGKAAKGGVPNAKKLNAMHGIAALLFVVIVIMTEIGIQ